MKKQLVIEDCKECPYYYFDEYGYNSANGETEMRCDYLRKPIEVEEGLPDWCPLETYEGDKNTRDKIENKKAKLSINTLRWIIGARRKKH